MAYVALDYGHGADTWEKTGGKGVRRGGRVYEEHEFNADVGERTRKILEDHGVNVLITQPPNGEDVGLNYRTDFANREGVDLFVSFHANAGAATVSGACVFAWEGSKGNKAADAIVRHFKEAGINLHGNGRHISKYGSWTNFHVIRESNMPAILIEHGFMTNAHDFENIFGKNKEDYRQKCAESDARGILDYFGIEYNKISSAPKPNDNKKYRLATGSFGDAEALGEAHNKLKQAYGWMVYEKADDTAFNPALRLWTGTFTGKNVAEYYADQLRKEFGWKVYVKEA